MLNSYQKQALGIFHKQPFLKVLAHSDVLHLYQEVNQENLANGEQGQTYQEFLNMENIPPNQQGTGRFKFKEIDNIEIFCIPQYNSNKVPSQIINQIIQFVQTFLRIKCKKSNLNMRVKNNLITDLTKKLEFTMENDKEGRLEVFSMLNLLQQYKKANKSLVALIEQELQEQEELVDGRACGDGVAVISYSSSEINQHKKLEYLIQTILHQILHTVGFDHCIAWKCLMNPITNFQSWLCPACLRKLFSQIQLKDKEEIITWFQQVHRYFHKHKFHHSKKKGLAWIQLLKKY